MGKQELLTIDEIAAHLREEMENQELLTIEEMAARLKVLPSWLYSRTRLRGREAMPGVFRCGKYLRFEPRIVIEYIKEKYGRVQR